MRIDSSEFLTSALVELFAQGKPSERLTVPLSFHLEKGL